MTTVEDASPTAASARSVLWGAAPLLVGIGLMTAGSGLTSTLLGIRANLEGFRPSVVGVVLAGYYVGMVVGSLVTPSTIVRVGHIRVFSGVASLASAVVLVHLVLPQPLTWFALRMVSGLCLAALYIVAETWLNGMATNRTRGTLLASYMVVISASLLAGQLLFTLADPAGFAAFVLASVLVSLAVVPVSLANLTAPPVLAPDPLSLRDLSRAAPLAPVGAALSGFIGSAMLGGGTVYAAVVGLDRWVTGLFLGAALVGGAALQVPLGRWSDLVDRRVVILGSSLVAAAVALAIAAAGPPHRLVLIGLTTIAGGTSYATYSISNAHLNDYLDESKLVAGGSRMVLINGMGAVAGPIVGAAAIGRIGPGALFVVIALAHVAIAAFALVRLGVRAGVPEEERSAFTPIAAVPAPTTTGIEPDADELYEPHQGRVPVPGGLVAYRDQGEGPVVVLVGRPPGGPRTWDDVVPALALDGYRAIAPVVHGTDRAGLWVPGVDALLELLRHLELPAATFAGVGAGTAVVDQLAQQHPDRVEAVVLLAPAPDPAAAHPTVVVAPEQWADGAEVADDIAEALGAG